MDNTPTADSTTLPASTAMATRSDHPFRFLDLPAELREQVYSYLLIVGKIFYTPDWFELQEGSRFENLSAYAKPHVSLLRVSKQLHTEAEALYLSQNLFVLPPLWIANSPFRPFVFAQAARSDSDGQLMLPPDRPLFSARGMDLVRNVSVALCSRGQGPLGMTCSSWDAKEEGSSETFEALTRAERLSISHELALTRMINTWNNLLDYLSHFSRRLQYLELDLANAFCPFGCCRVLQVELGFLKSCRPRRTVVWGLRCEDEVDEFLDWAEVEWRLSEGRLRKKFGLSVCPDVDEWAAWAVEGANGEEAGEDEVGHVEELAVNNIEVV